PSTRPPSPKLSPISRSASAVPLKTDVARPPLTPLQAPTEPSSLAHLDASSSPKTPHGPRKQGSRARMDLRIGFRAPIGFGTPDCTVECRDDERLCTQI